MRLILASLVAALALAAPAQGLLTATESLPIGVLSYLPHGPILIEEDADFCADPVASGVVNCATADGSATSPFVIRGWSIHVDATNLLPAITLANTTLHVVVTDNSLLADPADVVPTVVLRDVANAALADNVLRAGLAPALVVDGYREAAPGSASTYPGIRGNEFLTSVMATANLTLATLSGADSVTLAGNAFLGTREPGPIAVMLDVSGSRRVELIEGLFLGHADTGLRATDVAQLLLTLTRVKDVESGVELTRTRASLAGVDLDGVARGVTASDSATLAISGSSFKDDFPCTPSCMNYGIASQRTALLLTNTRVEGFDTGLHYDGKNDTTLWATCNAFTGNLLGVLVRDYGAETFRYNSIAGNAAGLANSGASEFDAERNWWGHPSGPAPIGLGDSISGKVDAEHPLAAPPTTQCE